jgi:hypothetical protein
MPRLSKPKGNARTCRLSIEDELVEWAGWDYDEFVVIEPHMEPNAQEETMERYLLLRSIQGGKKPPKHKK